MHHRWEVDIKCEKPKYQVWLWGRTGDCFSWPLLLFAPAGHQRPSNFSPPLQLLRTVGQKKRWLGLLGSTHAAEVRRYAPYLMAEVTVEGEDMRDALSQGFRAIAGFIFGKNLAPSGGGSEKVAMTSPGADCGIAAFQCRQGRSRSLPRWWPTLNHCWRGLPAQHNAEPGPVCGASAAAPLPCTTLHPSPHPPPPTRGPQSRWRCLGSSPPPRSR